MAKLTVPGKADKDVPPDLAKGQPITRIDEEDLFNHFTADIMKLKKKFIR